MDSKLKDGITNEWKTTTKRFVAFFDIMGFKELVERNSHNVVVKKLKKLKDFVTVLENMHQNSYVTDFFKLSESKAITFSDSIIIFSKDDSKESLTKIIIDSSLLIWSALENEIPIKGALSYGEITVDFESSLFFGRPIIDAYLLHDQLQIYTALLDHNIEKKVKLKNLHNELDDFVIEYEANLKSGKIKHCLIKPPSANIDEEIKNLSKIYNSVSGQPRIYVDNTLKFLEHAKKPL